MNKVLVNENLTIRENDESFDLMAESKFFYYYAEDDIGFLKIKKETAEILIKRLRELLNE